jgi:hypothetical protein
VRRALDATDLGFSEFDLCPLSVLLRPGTESLASALLSAAAALEAADDAGGETAPLRILPEEFCKFSAL